MGPGMSSGWIAAVVIAAVGFDARSADLQIKTLDGQVLQGEYLGTTEENHVKLRTSFGVVTIPSKSIVTLTAIQSAAKPDVPVTVSAEERPVLRPFPKPKPVSLSALVASRSGPPPEPANKQDRQELHRLVRNFGDSSNASRLRIIRQLRDYGAVAHPFIAATYTHPLELGTRIELLEALAVKGNIFTAPIFADTHTEAGGLKEFRATTPPDLPREYNSQRDLDDASRRVADIKGVSQYLLTIEDYAATAGGPFNAIFLLGVYTQRYAGTVDPLVSDSARDAKRLGVAAADARSTKPLWTTDDRMLLAEHAIPLLFTDNTDLKAIAKALLEKVLPTSHPKWEAAEDVWAEWWELRATHFEKK